MSSAAAAVIRNGRTVERIAPWRMNPLQTVKNKNYSFTDEVHYYEAISPLMQQIGTTPTVRIRSGCAGCSKPASGAADAIHHVHWPRRPRVFVCQSPFR